jgi:hypothetical protein
MQPIMLQNANNAGKRATSCETLMNLRENQLASLAVAQCN